MAGYSWIALVVPVAFELRAVDTPYVHDELSRHIDWNFLSRVRSGGDPYGCANILLHSDAIDWTNPRSASLLIVLAGLATFIIGGLTGVMIAIAPFDERTTRISLLVICTTYWLAAQSFRSLQGSTTTIPSSPENVFRNDSARSHFG